MRTSSALRHITDKLHCVDSDVWERGVHLRLRMNIVELGDGRLWLCAPGPIGEHIGLAIGALGEVSHIVAPNLNHYKFVPEAKRRFPNAVVYGAPGLATKRPALPIARTLEEPHEVGGGMSAIHIQGMPDVNEFVFYHRPSATLICTDLVQNVQDEDGFMTRLLYRAIGSWKKFGQNRYWKYRTRDRAAARASLERVLAWDFDRIVMAHGDIVQTGGREKLRASLAWLFG
ncbi:MAG TPA: DUF4336 domain-containing protein [Polyangiaceae bacterium]|nr:DUF4336 domain-containing protein [Polyangiaceae bacterium]